MKLFNFTINQFDLPAFNDSDERDEVLVEYCNGVVWNEIESSEQPKPKYSSHILATNGVSVWYDYYADYYFFEDLN